MKNAIYLFLILWILPLASCQLGNKKKIVGLNDTLVKINMELNQQGVALGEEVRNSIETGDYTAIKPKRDTLEQFITTSLEKVRQIEDVGGSEALRSKEIEFLEFEQQIVPVAFGQFEYFNANTTEEEMTRAFTSMDTVGRGETRLLSEFRQLQKAYAEKNNFKLAEMQ